MEKSEKHRGTIELGRKIAEDLGTTSRSDFLGGWMAHYVAELIERYDNSVGVEKDVAGDHAFAAILRLWNHRYQSSSGFDAIKRAGPIMETLSRLDPEEKRPFYFFNPPGESGQNGDDCKVLSEIALGVDRTARKLIKMLLLTMTMKETDEETTEYIRLAMSESLTGDLKAVGELMTDVNSEDFPQRFQDLIQEVRDFGLICENFVADTNTRPSEE